jgi:hypothetical protein
MPANASHPDTLASVRNPMIKATPTTTTTEIRFATMEVSTCAHKTAAREIGMDVKRSKMPPCRSRNNRYAV